eukprot:237248-Pelagomonas_calceolata.AAC.1
MPPSPAPASLLPPPARAPPSRPVLSQPLPALAHVPLPQPGPAAGPPLPALVPALLAVPAGRNAHPQVVRTRLLIAQWPATGPPPSALLPVPAGLLRDPATVRAVQCMLCCNEQQATPLPNTAKLGLIEGRMSVPP